MKIVSLLASCVAFALLAVASLQAQTVTGSGTAGRIPIWTSSSHLGNSIISQSGTEVTIRGAVFGDSNGDGLRATSASGFGVLAASTSADAVKGLSDHSGGVVGGSTSGDGTVGLSCEGTCGGAAIVGIGHRAGYFDGSVSVLGNFGVTGLKAFHIDHPLDPANKYLNHFAIESNEGLDTYSGNVTTDARGTAIVELPDYFEALNTNYRYQLTVIGQFAQAIILQEIQNNRFVIRTDKPSVKVSWQVTGVRSDAYVKAHPMPVEEDKPEQERGYYLAPELFGQPEERSITWLYHGDVMREAKALEQKRQEQGAAKALGQKLEQEVAATAPR
jgi:hypothetical protein